MMRMDKGYQMFETKEPRAACIVQDGRVYNLRREFVGPLPKGIVQKDIDELIRKGETTLLDLVEMAKKEKVALEERHSAQSLRRSIAETVPLDEADEVADSVESEAPEVEVARRPGRPRKTA